MIPHNCVVAAFCYTLTTHQNKAKRQLISNASLSNHDHRHHQHNLTTVLGFFVKSGSQSPWTAKETVGHCHGGSMTVVTQPTTASIITTRSVDHGRPGAPSIPPPIFYVEWAHPIFNLKQCTVLRSLNFGIWSMITAVAILRMLYSSQLTSYTHIAIISELFPNISLCCGTIKDRQAIVAIFEVCWSLLSVKALKMLSPPQSCNRMDASNLSDHVTVVTGGIQACTEDGTVP